MPGDAIYTELIVLKLRDETEAAMATATARFENSAKQISSSLARIGPTPESVAQMAGGDLALSLRTMSALWQGHFKEVANEAKASAADMAAVMRVQAADAEALARQENALWSAINKEKADIAKAEAEEERDIAIALNRYRKEGVAADLAAAKSAAKEKADIAKAEAAVERDIAVELFRYRKEGMALDVAAAKTAAKEKAAIVKQEAEAEAAIEKEKAALIQSYRNQAAAEQAERQAGYSVGRGVVTAGLMVGVPMAVGAVKEFDQELAHMSTLLGDSGTSADRFSEQVEAAGETAKRVAAQFNLTTSDVIKGMKEMLSSGIDPSQLDAFSDKVGALARATQGNFEHIATMMTSVRDAYGMTVSQMGHVSDVIFNTINVGKVKNVEELTTNLGRLLPVAAAAGMSFETMMTGIAGIGRAGTTTGQTITEMGDIIKTLQSPSDKMAERMHALGIATGQAAFAGKDMTQVLQELLTATGGDMDILNKLFPDIRGKRGVDALTMIQHALGGIEKGVKELDTTAAASQHDLDTFWDHIGQKWESLIGTGKELGRVTAQMLDTLIFGGPSAKAGKAAGGKGTDVKVTSIDPFDDENMTAGFKHAFEYGVGLKRWMLAGIGSKESADAWADMTKALNPGTDAAGNKIWHDAVESATADMAQLISQAEKAHGALREVVAMKAEDPEIKKLREQTAQAEHNDLMNRATKEQKDKLASLNLEDDHEALAADTDARAANAALVKRQAEYNALLAEQVKRVHDAAPEDQATELVRLQTMNKEMRERLEIDKKFYGDQNAGLHEARIDAIREEKASLEDLIKTQMTQNELKESDARAKAYRAHDNLRQDLNKEMREEMIKEYDEDEKNYEKFEDKKLSKAKEIAAKLVGEAQGVAGIQEQITRDAFKANLRGVTNDGKDPRRGARFAGDQMEEKQREIEEGIRRGKMTKEQFEKELGTYRSLGETHESLLSKGGDERRSVTSEKERAAVEQGMLSAFQKMSQDRGVAEIAGVKGAVFKRKSKDEIEAEATRRVTEKHVDQVIQQTITVNAQGITAAQFQGMINDSVTKVLSNIKARGTGVTDRPTTSRGTPVGRVDANNDGSDDE